MIKILLSGCNGRMGKAVSEMCIKNPDTTIVAGFDLYTEKKFDYPVYDDFCAISEEVDVVIDFSNPKALTGLLEYCVNAKVPVVLCTTGYSEEELALVEKASEAIPVFRSGNMSLGINVLMMLARRAAQVLGGSFDIEIIERHHNQKLDAPSGTAIMLAEAVESALEYQAERVYDRHNVRAKRAYNEIGMHSVRGGTIVGEHEVIFAGENETIELSHSAQSREVFAAGAVKAAVYLAACDAAGKYNMDDLISSCVDL